MFYLLIMCLAYVPTCYSNLRDIIQNNVAGPPVNFKVSWKLNFFLIFASKNQCDKIVTRCYHRKNIISSSKRKLYKQKTI